MLLEPETCTNMLFSKILDIGIDDKIEFYQKREIRILNIFALITLTGLIIGLSTVFFLNGEYPTATVSFTMICSAAIFLLNHWRLSHISTYLFIISTNVTLFILNKMYVPGAGNYLYYFPMIFCVALIHNPSKSLSRTVIFFLVCLVSFAAAEFIKTDALMLPGITPDDVDTLLIYNSSLNVLITMVMVYLVIRLINKQNKEVVALLEKEHEAQSKISHSLKEKETLLAEIQHRVKNNLAVITGLLNLQTEKAPCDVSKELMIESRNRVMSIAMVHERLYKKDNLAKIDFKLYLSELVNEVISSFPTKQQVEIIEDLDNAEIEITKAVPIGLILNEALTNSLKHAFQDEEINSPKIMISMQTIYDRMQISLSDNGKGFLDLDRRKDTSLGISLIESLADQIDAKVVFRNENGATVSLVFPI